MAGPENGPGRDRLCDLRAPRGTAVEPEHGAGRDVETVVVGRLEPDGAGPQSELPRRDVDAGIDAERLSGGGWRRDPLALDVNPARDRWHPVLAEQEEHVPARRCDACRRRGDGVESGGIRAG